MHLWWDWNRKSPRKLTFTCYSTFKRWQKSKLLIVFVLTLTSHSIEKQRFKEGPGMSFKLPQQSNTHTHTKNVCSAVTDFWVFVFYTVISNTRLTFQHFYSPQKGLQMSRDEWMKQKEWIKICLDRCVTMSWFAAVPPMTVRRFFWFITTIDATFV